MTETHKIRVRVLDGKPRKYPDIRKVLGTDIRATADDSAGKGLEFVLEAPTPKRLEEARAKLNAAGLEEIEGSVAVRPVKSAPTARAKPVPRKHREFGAAAPSKAKDSAGPPPSAENLEKRAKPYDFVALPGEFEVAPPVWHDGSSTAGRVSGEIRCELRTLTPLLVGWERQTAAEIRAQHGDLEVVRGLADKKSVLCPLRAPWGQNPVLIPGDSLKGLLRQELGALFGAPMERVAERTYSYRPNMQFPLEGADRRLEPRPARVVKTMPAQVASLALEVPVEVDLHAFTRRGDQTFDAPGALPYRGGMGAGKPLPKEVLPEKRGGKVHTSVDLGPTKIERSAVPIGAEIVNGYLRTIKHLLDEESGHFSARHPGVGKDRDIARRATKVIEAGGQSAMKAGDVIWVEWDKDEQRVVSLGYHYYYRWAYLHSVRTVGDGEERNGLFPADEETSRTKEGAPQSLTAVRRLLGYSGDNPGSQDIGEGNYTQLMGRVSINAAIESVAPEDTDGTRFLDPTFLKELGQPRPSAVEFYLKQPHPKPHEQRPSDRAKLRTYGDAARFRRKDGSTGKYDEPGELAGRKFYLDRKDAYTGTPWEDSSPDNRLNERSTLAIGASRQGHAFRFTLRFRDLDRIELAAILLAFCPNQFAGAMGGTWDKGYCSKLGYARPLGWGSVDVTAKELHFVEPDGDARLPALRQEADIATWFEGEKAPLQERAKGQLAEWLNVHRRQNPRAGDYPRKKEEVYTYHSDLRAEHAKLRRYRKVT